jgi:hypothetical protein
MPRLLFLASLCLVALLVGCSGGPDTSTEQVGAEVPATEDAIYTQSELNAAVYDAREEALADATAHLLERLAVVRWEDDAIQKAAEAGLPDPYLHIDLIVRLRKIDEIQARLAVLDEAIGTPARLAGVVYVTEADGKYHAFECQPFDTVTAMVKREAVRKYVVCRVCGGG